MNDEEAIRWDYLQALYQFNLKAIEKPSLLQDILTAIGPIKLAGGAVATYQFGLISWDDFQGWNKKWAQRK